MLRIKYAVFNHPWTRGIFNEGLKSYYYWLTSEGSQQIDHGVIQTVLDEAHLLNITAKPESQGRDLDLRLFRHLMHEAVGHQTREYFFEVRASNRAAYRLYERYGFNEIGRRHDYYPAVGRREGALVMAYTLFD